MRDALFAQADPDTQETYINMAEEGQTPAHTFTNTLFEGLAGEAIPVKIEGNVITLGPQVTY